MLVGIRLIFERGEVYHEALGDYDEISCDSAMKGEFNKSVDISNSSPWKGAVGRDALWAWRMINNQGYLDGIQYSFANNAGKDEKTIQLLTIASEVKIYTVSEG